MKKYLLLQWTWGILGNIIGGIVFIFCLFLTCPIKMYHNAIDITVPWNGAAATLGMFIFRGADCNSIMPHEYGHTLQNIKYGPVSLFIVQIPSVIRFWYREKMYHAKGIQPPTAYDDAWFEGEATKLGTAAINDKLNLDDLRNNE